VSAGCKCRSPPLGELTAIPQIPQLDLRGHFKAGKKKRKEKGKGKERKGTEKTPRNKFPLISFIIFNQTTKELNGHALIFF